jgi:hypothetical protein
MSVAEPAAHIGLGRVWHRRLRPVVNEFSYPSFFVLLPLRSSIGPLTDWPGLARNRFGPLSFFDSDHGDGGADALAWIEGLLQREGIGGANGTIWLQTYPRLFGYAFKPVSFWYCERVDGTLAAIVAEVNNTFGERHCYLLAGPELAWGHEQRAAKVFHVSPFCTTSGSYRFTFRREAAAISACIDHDDRDGLLLQTRIAGRLQGLSPRSAALALLRMPLMTFGVIARIHWQALRLWLKGVPFVRKPAPPNQFTTRSSPGSSP